jgi:hypothetical protein
MARAKAPSLEGGEAAAPSNLSGGFRTDAESKEGGRNRACFERHPGTWEYKMENFPKYVRRQNLTRFIALYEIFKKVLNVKGSVVECGVYEGAGLMTWAKLSAILEPVNLTRRVYGFDSFKGFPKVSAKDTGGRATAVRRGGLFADSFKELTQLIAAHDSTRFLGHIEKVRLIRGDATKTIRQFVRDNPHLVVSLLFMDFDLYEPTRVALEHFLPRMPKGAIIAFDELDNPLWPGETQAMMEVCGAGKLRIERLPFDPYIGYARID